MQKYLPVLIIALVAGLFPAAAMAQPTIDWPLVARAQVIVVATPVPLDPSASAANADAAKQVGPGYYAMELTEPKYLKGYGLGSKWPAYTPVVVIPEGEAVPPSEPSLFFLTELIFSPKADELRFDPATGIERYFPPETRSWLYALADGNVGSSVRKYTDGNTAITLFHMVRNWEAVEEARRLSRSFTRQSAPLETFLTEISKAPADPENQKALMRKLQADFGIRAFDYLIYHIERRRPFPAGSLILETAGGDVTLKPAEMIDAIDAMLLAFDGGKAAKELYGIDRRFLKQEPSERARENAIRAWQIHLGRKSVEFTLH